MMKSMQDTSNSWAILNSSQAADDGSAFMKSENGSRQLDVDTHDKKDLMIHSQYFNTDTNEGAAR